MAKRKVFIGDIVKGKKDEATGVTKPDYLKVRGDHTLRDGQYLNLESKKQQLDSLNEAVAKGRLSAEVAEEIKAKIEKTPDFVRFAVSTMVERE